VVPLDADARGYAVITVTGRKTGRPRSLAVRAIPAGATPYVVAALGQNSDWLKNARKTPNVEAKLGWRTRPGVAREVTDATESASARRLYVETTVPYDYVDYVSVQWGWPSKRSIRRAAEEWINNGTLVAIDLEAGTERSSSKAMPTVSREAAIRKVGKK
jgi:deazaflavin-dependent oxidoreductase (nitroreductase family)